MPSYGKLRQVELGALVAYLEALRAVSADGSLKDAPAVH
jgi:hypothetical protein